VFEQRKQEAYDSEQVRHQISEAYDQILVAETSCNFYWGSQWVHRSFDALEKAYSLLDQAMAHLQGVSG
jgi:hypothetical protein